MTETKAEATTGAAWMDVLDQMEHSLGRTLARTTEFEGPPAPPEVASNPLERLDERLATWAKGLEGVERQAQVADALLEAEQKALADWLEKLGQVQKSFMAWMNAYTSPKL